MYSPKVPERFIPILYRLGRDRGRPMTQLVAEAVERYLEEAGWLQDGMCPDRDAEAASGRSEAQAPP